MAWRTRPLNHFVSRPVLLVLCSLIRLFHPKFGTSLLETLCKPSFGSPLCVFACAIESSFCVVFHVQAIFACLSVLAMTKLCVEWLRFRRKYHFPLFWRCTVFLTLAISHFPWKHPERAQHTTIAIDPPLYPNSRHQAFGVRSHQRVTCHRTAWRLPSPSYQ